MSEERVVPITQDAGIVLASDLGRAFADRAGLSLVAREELRTAIVEITHNALRFAGRGEARLRLIHVAGRSGVEVVVRDEGPGLPPSGAPRNPGSGLGAGISAARRLVDEFSLASSPGGGTIVTLVKWSR